jgi:peptidyl-Asp metalloendopeptidase
VRKSARLLAERRTVATGSRRKDPTRCAVPACLVVLVLSLLAPTISGAQQQYAYRSVEHHTGTGWERLDYNTWTVQIVASGGKLYQLRNKRWPGYLGFIKSIWRYIGPPCPPGGQDCRNWMVLAQDSATVALAADGGKLYQLQRDGRILEFVDGPCGPTSCGSWMLIDNNPLTKEIVAAGGNLYQLHRTGWIWRYTGIPCNVDTCPGWELVDNGAEAVQIAGGGKAGLYQLQGNGWIRAHPGQPCSNGIISCPAWNHLDNNGATKKIIAGRDKLFQMHSNGWIWEYTNQLCSGSSCPGWKRLDNNPATIGLATGFTTTDEYLYQLHANGGIWKYTNHSCSGDSCLGWQLLGFNPFGRAGAIAADGDKLYRIQVESQGIFP